MIKVSVEEILYALRDLGRGKAVGPDGIPNEMMFGLSWRSAHWNGKGV